MSHVLVHDKAQTKNAKQINKPKNKMIDIDNVDKNIVSSQLAHIKSDENVTVNEQ